MLAQETLAAAELELVLQPKDFDVNCVTCKSNRKCQECCHGCSYPCEEMQVCRNKPETQACKPEVIAECRQQEHEFYSHDRERTLMNTRT